MPLGCIPAGLNEFLIVPCKNDFTSKITCIDFIDRLSPFGRSRGKFNDLGASTFSASAPCAGPIPFTITAADGAGLSLSLALTGVAFTSSTTAVFSLTYAIDGGSGHLAYAAGPGTMSVAIVATDATLTGGKLSGTLAGTMTE